MPHGRTRRQRRQRGGKTFRANRPPSGVKFKLLNVQSILKKYTHKALIRSNHSWAAIKATSEYAALKADAEKFFRGKDLGDMYALYMLDGDHIVCAVTFIPNVEHRYEKDQISYVPDNKGNANSVPATPHPHVSTEKDTPQDIAYIDYLSCSKGTKAYENFLYKPASYYLLYQALKLIQTAGTRFVTLTVAADAGSHSKLYLLYKDMGFYCIPKDDKEHADSFPFLFTRLSHAERLATLERIRSGNTYLNRQERKAMKNRNNLERYMNECGYMVGETAGILERLGGIALKN